MVKRQKGLKLNEEVIDDIEIRSKEQNFNFNEWVERAYIREFMAISSLKNQQKFHERLAKKYKNKADYLKRKCTKNADSLKVNSLIMCNTVKPNISRLEDNEKNHTLKIIEKYPEKLEFQLKYWNNKYKKNFTKAEFLQFLGLNA